MCGTIISSGIRRIWKSVVIYYKEGCYRNIHMIDMRISKKVGKFSNPYLLTHAISITSQLSLITKIGTLQERVVVACRSIE